MVDEEFPGSSHLHNLMVASFSLHPSLCRAYGSLLLRRAVDESTESVSRVAESHRVCSRCGMMFATGVTCSVRVVSLRRLARVPHSQKNRLKGPKRLYSFVRTKCLMCGHAAYTLSKKRPTVIPLAQQKIALQEKKQKKTQQKKAKKVGNLQKKASQESSQGLTLESFLTALGD